MPLDERSFLDKIRDADLHVRRRWAIGVGALFAAVAIFAWVAYVNDMMARFNRGPEEIVLRAEEKGLLSLMRSGAASAYGVLQAAIAPIVHFMESGEEVTIQ